MRNLDGKLYQRRIAYHEAGHAVMAVILWKKIEFARLHSFYEFEHENVGFVRTKDEKPSLSCDCSFNHRRYLESEILFSLAGYVAQYIYPTKRVSEYDLEERFDEDLLSGGEGSDYDSLSKILKILVTEFEGDEDNFSEAYLRFLIATCRHILKHPIVWQAVKTVAELLLEKREISGREIYQSCDAIEGFEQLCEKYQALYL